MTTLRNVAIYCNERNANYNIITDFFSKIVKKEVCTMFVKGKGYYYLKGNKVVKTAYCPKDLTVLSVNGVASVTATLKQSSNYKVIAV